MPLLGTLSLRGMLGSWTLRWLGAATALYGAILAVGLLFAATPLHELDERLFRWVNGFGPGPDLLWTLFDPHTRNYVVLLVLTAALAAMRSLRTLPRALAQVLGAALVSWGLLEALYAVYDRDRPEEVFGASAISLNGHTWARLESFPSGHMAITAALAVSMALLFPRLRLVLWAYVAAVAVTRILFGAHFTLDVLAGTALGAGSALLAAHVFDRLRRPAAAAAEPLAEDAAVAAVMPSHNDVPDPALVRDVLAHVDRLVLVDDGSEAAVAAQLDALAKNFELELVRLPERSGKGSAVRAGVDHVRGRTDAVLVIDADGQHPAAAIPAFVAAGRDAELVIGDRFANVDSMPRERRFANRTTRLLFQLLTGHAVRDTQNGMRLLRGGALETLPAGGYEAETTHLRRVLTDRRPVAWVPIPAIYGSERSSFRPVRDSARVLWALVRPLERGGRPRARRRLRAPSLRARRARSGRRDRRGTARPPRQARAAAT